MSMSNARQTVDALNNLRHENLVFRLHVSDDFHGLRKGFVAFGETIQPFVDIHLFIVYPRRDYFSPGRANFDASIGTFARTSLSSKVSFPSSQVTVQRKGILTPATSR